MGNLPVEYILIGASILLEPGDQLLIFADKKDIPLIRSLIGLV